MPHFVRTHVTVDATPQVSKTTFQQEGLQDNSRVTDHGYMYFRPDVKDTLTTVCERADAGVNIAVHGCQTPESSMLWAYLALICVSAAGFNRVPAGNTNAMLLCPMQLCSYCDASKYSPTHCLILFYASHPSMHDVPWRLSCLTWTEPVKKVRA